MKIRFLLICFTLHASLIFGQYGKWSLGFSFSPDICYRTLGGPDSLENLIRQRDQDEHMKIGYTTGLNLKHTVNSAISLESGILYSNKGYMYRPDEPLVFGSQINPAPGTTPTYSPVFVGIKYHFKYIDIPLKISFRMMRRERVSIYVTTGMVCNVLMEQKSSSIYILEDGKRHVNAYYGNPRYAGSRINISPFIGQGLELSIRERITLQVELLFRYGIIPIYDSPIRGYLWNCGLNGVLYYRI
jgi:hypothetical protein